MLVRDEMTGDKRPEVLPMIPSLPMRLWVLAATGGLLMTPALSAGQGRLEGWLSVGSAKQQGAGADVRERGTEVSGGAVLSTGRLGWGLEFGRVEFDGKVVTGTGGPIRASSVNASWAAALLNAATRDHVVSPVLGVGIGLADVRDSGDPRSVSAPALFGQFGVAAQGGRLFARLSATQRVFLTSKGTTDGELLRNYSLALALGLR